MGRNRGGGHSTRVTLPHPPLTVCPDSHSPSATICKTFLLYVLLRHGIDCATSLTRQGLRTAARRSAHVQTRPWVRAWLTSTLTFKKLKMKDLKFWQHWLWVISSGLYGRAARWKYPTFRSNRPHPKGRLTLDWLHSFISQKTSSGLKWPGLRHISMHCLHEVSGRLT